MSKRRKAKEEAASVYDNNDLQHIAITVLQLHIELGRAQRELTNLKVALIAPTAKADTKAGSADKEPTDKTS